MKKILITGLNSYVGTSLKTFLESYPNDYSVDTISLRNEFWKKVNFSKYDVVFHVAGIAHVSSDPNLEETYYQVNRDLTIETAKKAKLEGVKQFIFMSSIIVYGDSCRDRKVIDQKTVPMPSNFYGNSKLQAEEGIKSLQNDSFKVVIIRPPMIYGKNSKGNYPKLAKIARISPFFPDITNQRSIIHIDNLNEFIRLMIKNEESGLFFPQNTEYVKTSELVKHIAEFHGKKIRLIKIVNPLINLIIPKVSLFSKVFGNLSYDKNLSNYKENYRIRTLRESIIETENVGERKK